MPAMFPLLSHVVPVEETCSHPTTPNMASLKPLESKDAALLFLPLLNGGLRNNYAVLQVYVVAYNTCDMLKKNNPQKERSFVL